MAITLALGALSGCVAVRYQRPGQRITPREGKTLVVGRLRFFHDGREFFPWRVTLIPSPGTNTERHVWLLRLGQRAVSAEVHPDPDGSLAIWLARGDYALVGSMEATTSGPAAFEMVALVRVPAGALVAFAGDLTMKTESHEGFHVSYGEFGTTSVDMPSIDTARATLEQRFGPLPQPPIVSAWCAGDSLPSFNDARLASRGRALLDRGCPGGR